MASSMHDRGLSGEHQFYTSPTPELQWLAAGRFQPTLFFPSTTLFYESHSQECHVMQNTMLAWVWNCMDEPFCLAPSLTNQPKIKLYFLVWGWAGGREAPQFHKDTPKTQNSKLKTQRVHTSRAAGIYGFSGKKKTNFYFRTKLRTRKNSSAN